ncbi:MAG: hypothetical protein Q7R66_01260 [Undibacterium sp.]|uniref:hypothetical protein n=1 Tax=Undibacterium sp. TaxID=1914977 RepID=UPI00271B875E|nr:hypothetical protein [Undibacterium sp.]MDO8650806.1 hypothetical protein [Undibacterium sp.]
MTPLHIHTPLWQQHSLSSQLDHQVWLKMESGQLSGAVKLRGIGVDLLKLQAWGKL